jgi:hypothetical protein
METPGHDENAKKSESAAKHSSNGSKVSTTLEARSGQITRKPDGPRTLTQVDRLLRYEASLEGAFDRTSTQLERLQRMRLGQPVSSPINLDISSS